MRSRVMCGYQLNSFFETTERLPEIDFDLKRQPLGNTGIFYEGETSAAELNRNFPTGSAYEDYSAFRIDCFHQLTYPKTYFGWLSIVPRVGFRETYYSQTRDLGTTLFPTGTSDPLAPEFPLPNPTIDTSVNPLFLGGDTFRSHFQRRAREFVQDLARMGRGAVAGAWARRPAPHHSALTAIFPTSRTRRRSAFDSCSSIASSLRPS